LRHRFAQAADDLIERVVAKGEFDGVADVAEAFPLSVFPDAVGVAKEGREFLLTYGSLTFDAIGPRDERLQREMEAAAPAIAWVQTQTQRTAIAPGGLGAAIHDAVDTGEITPDEAPLLVRSLLSAGLDTTVSGLAAALHCLARSADQFRRLRANPALARAAFEEAVRLESPVQHFFRTTTRDVDMAGVPIGKGEKVLVFFGAANRDPRRWKHAGQYDITRENAGHVGFGAGIHNCVGQVLARLEGEVILAALARTAESITINGPVRYKFNNSLRCLETLPLNVRPAARNPSNSL